MLLRAIRFMLSLSVLALGLVGSAPAQEKFSNKTHIVLIQGSAFVPNRLEIARGDTVIWKNEDVVPHTATGKNNFDSKELGPRRSWSYVANRKGIYPFMCTYHPTMQGELVVK
jgi:plastocyanin